MIKTEQQNTTFRRAAELLPMPLRSAIYKTVRDYRLDSEKVTDIRLRRGARSFLSVGRRSYPIEPILSVRQLDSIVFALTDGSVYAHAETIREGYISVGGIRCGVTGRAVQKNGKTETVTEYSSVTIRIPHDVPGCAADIFDLYQHDRGHGILIYSPPAVGKTTLLRDLMRSLSSIFVQFSVIDTRGELSFYDNSSTADTLLYYPKYEGIKTAVRSLSPELIICDELSGELDANAALYAYSCGVPLIATCHAGNKDELSARPEMKRLLTSGAFGYTVGLSRRDGDNGFSYNIEKLL